MSVLVVMVLNQSVAEYDWFLHLLCLLVCGQ